MARPNPDQAAATARRWLEGFREVERRHGENAELSRERYASVLKEMTQVARRLTATARQAASNGRWLEIMPRDPWDYEATDAKALARFINRGTPEMAQRRYEDLVHQLGEPEARKRWDAARARAKKA